MDCSERHTVVFLRTHRIHLAQGDRSWPPAPCCTGRIIVIQLDGSKKSHWWIKKERVFAGDTYASKWRFCTPETRKGAGVMYYTTTVITTMPATPYTAALYNSNATQHARRLFQTQEFMLKNLYVIWCRGASSPTIDRLATENMRSSCNYRARLYLLVFTKCRQVIAGIPRPMNIRLNVMDTSLHQVCNTRHLAATQINSSIKAWLKCALVISTTCLAHPSISFVLIASPTGSHVRTKEELESINFFYICWFIVKLFKKNDGWSP